MHSTCTTLLFATDLCLRGIEEGILTGNVFIDLKKAFHTVDYATLSQTLNYYGIKRKYLSGLSHTTKTGVNSLMLVTFSLMKNM